MSWGERVGGAVVGVGVEGGVKVGDPVGEGIVGGLHCG